MVKHCDTFTPFSSKSQDTLLVHCGLPSVLFTIKFFSLILCHQATVQCQCFDTVGSVEVRHLANNNSVSHTLKMLFGNKQREKNEGTGWFVTHFMQETTTIHFSTSVHMPCIKSTAPSKTTITTIFSGVTSKPLGSLYTGYPSPDYNDLHPCSTTQSYT